MVIIANEMATMIVGSSGHRLGRVGYATAIILLIALMVTWRTLLAMPCWQVTLIPLPLIWWLRIRDIGSWGWIFVAALGAIAVLVPAALFVVQSMTGGSGNLLWLAGRAAIQTAAALTIALGMLSSQIK